MHYLRLHGIKVDLPSAWHELDSQQLQDIAFAYRYSSSADELRHRCLLSLFRAKKSWRIMFIFLVKGTLQGLESLYKYLDFLRNPLKDNLFDHMTAEHFITLQKQHAALSSWDYDKRAEAERVFFETLSHYTKIAQYPIGPLHYTACVQHYRDMMDKLSKAFKNVFEPEDSTTRGSNNRFGWEAVLDEFSPSPADIDRQRKALILDVLMRFERTVLKNKELEKLSRR